VAFLEDDPARRTSELATVRQLARSEVEYRVRVGTAASVVADGDLTTDGERVYVTLAGDSMATPFRRFSMRSCLAHELEHARQFDDGELAFEREPGTGRWRPLHSTYDIGDEVKAWSAQLRVSRERDLWRRTDWGQIPRPSLLGEFAEARTDEARARVLRRNGYGNVYPVAGCLVRFPNGEYRPGQLVRPSLRPGFFGRVARRDSLAPLNPDYSAMGGG
jgi:hypothetical protein